MDCTGLFYDMGQRSPSCLCSSVELSLTFTTCVGSTLLEGVVHFHRVEQAYINAYEGEGWKGANREKVCPTGELKQAHLQVNIICCLCEFLPSIHYSRRVLYRHMCILNDASSNSAKDV